MLSKAQIDKNSVTELWKMYLYYFSGLVSEIDKSSETNASVVSQCNTRHQRQRKQEHNPVSNITKTQKKLEILMKS